MPTQKRVVTNFSSAKYSDSDLYTVSQAALYGLTGNTYFPGIPSLVLLTQPPAPNPPVLNLTDASADYFTKLIEARKGGKDRIDAKNVAREVLEDILGSWANYVNLISKGNTAMLQSSRFDLIKEPQRVGILPKPENFKVRAIGKGQLELSVEKINGAYSYQWELEKVGSEEPKITKTTRTTTVLITDLESIKQYHCRVVGIGADDSAENWSDAITSTVL